MDSRCATELFHAHQLVWTRPRNTLCLETVRLGGGGNAWFIEDGGGKKRFRSKGEKGEGGHGVGFRRCVAVRGPEKEEYIPSREGHGRHSLLRGPNDGEGISLKRGRKTNRF